MMLNLILSTVSIALKVIDIILKLTELLKKDKDKHQKSNRSDQS